MFEMSQWRTLTRHPFSEAFGDMSEVEFESVLADMTQHGYDPKQQIILFQGKVLDGWHRQRGGVMIGKMPTYDEFKGTEDEAELLAVRRNLNRRHLDTSQRGLIAGRFANMKHGGNRTKKVDFQDANLQLDPPHKTLEKVADEFKVSERTAADGKKVATNGTSQLQAAVLDKTISVSDAAKVADEPAKVQNEAVKKVRKGKSKTVKAAVNQDADDAPDEKLPRSVLVDNDGTPVPKNLRDAFVGNTDLIATSIKLLQEVQRTVKALRKWNPYMRPGEMETKVGELIDDFKKGKPHIVCPSCKGKGCKDVCRTEGWLPEWRAKEMKS